MFIEAEKKSCENSPPCPGDVTTNKPLPNVVSSIPSNRTAKHPQSKSLQPTTLWVKTLTSYQYECNLTIKFTFKPGKICGNLFFLEWFEGVPPFKEVGGHGHEGHFPCFDKEYIDHISPLLNTFHALLPNDLLWLMNFQNVEHGRIILTAVLCVVNRSESITDTAKPVKVNYIHSNVHSIHFFFQNLIFKIYFSL